MHYESITYALVLSFVLAAIVLVFLWRKRSENIINTNQRSDDNSLPQVIQLLSHDLRSPFAQVLTALSFGTEGYSDAEKETFNQMLQEKAEHGLFQIDNLLFWAKCQDQPASGLKKSTIQLRDLVQAISEKVKTVSGIKNNTVQVQVTNSTFTSHEPFVKQILENLLMHTLQYSPANSEISISGSIEQDSVVVTIADNDNSISSKTLSYLNQHIVKLPKSDGNSSSRGLGMDIYFSRVFIQHLGGTLTFSTSEKSGTKATIRLPLS